MKRRSLFLVGVILLLVFVTACSNNKIKAPADSNTFLFEYSTWVNEDAKNIFSSKEGYIQKDMVADGVEKKDWKISDEDNAKIEKLVREYDLPKLFNDLPGYLNGLKEKKFVSQITTKKFLYQIDGKNYEFKVTSDEYSSIEQSSEEYKIVEFIEKLEEILFKQEVYVKMPEANGAYH